MIAYVPSQISLHHVLPLVMFFPWTWTVELGCIAAVLLARFRARSTKGRLLRRAYDPSHVWVLPFYFWGMEGMQHFTRSMFVIGLVSPPEGAIFDDIFVVMVALFVLVVVQSLAVLVLGGPQATLGLAGGRHAAAVSVLVSLFLIQAFFMVFHDIFTRPYGLPLRLM